jgi:hypothetical protein
MESESEIEDFSAWVTEMGKPQVISLLLISISQTFLVKIEVYSQIGGSTRHRTHGFFQR